MAAKELLLLFAPSVHEANFLYTVFTPSAKNEKALKIPNNQNTRRTISFKNGKNNATCTNAQNMVKSTAEYTSFLIRA